MKGILGKIGLGSRDRDGGVDWGQIVNIVVLA